MPRIEEHAEQLSMAQFLLEHKSFPKGTEPDITGRRCDTHGAKLINTKWLGHVDRVFSNVSSTENEQFKQCPPELDRSALKKFSEICDKEEVQKLFTSANSYQAESVKHWNEHIENVTVEEKKAKSEAASDAAIAKKLGYNRFAIESVWVEGRKRLTNDDIKRKRTAARKRAQRKAAINEAVGLALASKKERGRVVFKEEVRCDVSPWTEHVKTMFPNMY